jgi:hypothetical protein
VRRHTALVAVAIAIAIAGALAGCGGGGGAATAGRASGSSGGARRSGGSGARSSRSGLRTAAAPAAASAKSRPKPAYPHVLPVAGLTGSTPFVPAVTLRGTPIAYVARSASGIALLSFNQHHLGLHLHSGTTDAGSTGWRYGSQIAGPELRRVVAGFNGAFKLSTDSGGFFSYGRTGAPLRDGLASVVSYADGHTDIGTWHGEVPTPGHGAVVSVRQNLSPLIDHGHAAASVGCDSCWGATVGGVAATARSAIGITAGGNLIWAGGLNLHVSDLAAAMLGARVVRAVEMDINPDWVAAYLYQHHGASAKVTPVPVSPGQQGIYGQLLLPYSRDFFTVDLLPGTH